MIKNIIIFALLSCIQHNLFSTNLSKELSSICEKTYDYEEAIINKLTREQFQTKVTNKVKSLLASKADPNWSDKKNNGCTALLLASRNGHKDAAQLLLDNNANIEATLTEQGWSSLHWACYFKKRDIIELLLNYKANINKRDKKGKLAIDLVRDANFNAELHGDIIELFSNENIAE